jgi:hypothetical protein
VGAVTFIQRFDSALRLNVHFHTLGLDGVYVRSSVGELVFHTLGEPTAADLEELARRTAERVRRALERAGRSLETDACADDALGTAEPALGLLYGAAVQGKDLSSASFARSSKSVRARARSSSPKSMASTCRPARASMAPIEHASRGSAATSRGPRSPSAA